MASPPQPEDPGTPPRPPPGWERSSACLEAGPEHFFAAEGEFYPDLPWSQWCNGCPVRAHCLAHALLNDEQWGVWGGMTPGARYRLSTMLVEGAVTWEMIRVTFHGREEDPA